MPPSNKAVPMPGAPAGVHAPASLGNLPVRMGGMAVLLLRASAIVLLMAPLVVLAAVLLN